MTEHEGPTEANLPDDDADWFRRQIDPVIGGDVPDAWDDIRSRTTGRHPILIPLPKNDAQPWPGRRLVAVAALLLVAVGVIGLGMKLVSDVADDDQVPAGGEDGDVTGFYVPGTLPDGWEVTSLSMDSMPGDLVGLECPCEVTEIRQRDGSDSYLTIDSADSPETFGSADGTSTSGWLDDRSDSYAEDGDVGAVSWHTASGSRSIASRTLDRAELESLAEGWTSDQPPVLDGFQVVDGWGRDQPIETEYSVRWVFTNTEIGQNLHVTMGPGMLSYELLAPPTVTLPGNELPLGIVDDAPEGVSAVANWPGNTLIYVMSLSTMAFNDELGNDYQATPPPDWPTVHAILGSFEPADAATWSDHLASAPIGEPDLGPDPETGPLDPEQLRTDSIRDWLIGPEPGTALPQQTTRVIHGDPDDPSTDMAAAITVESDVDHVAVATGEPFTIDLTMTNRTGAPVEVSGCSFGSVTWSTIDDNGLVTPGGGRDVDCDPATQLWADGEQRTRSFDFPGHPSEGPIAAVIQYGDNLSKGATVVIPGQVGG